MITADEKLKLLAELDGTPCSFSHGPYNKLPAVNYIVIPYGKIGESATDHLVLPVCQECIESVAGEEWTIIYCISCHASQWVFHQLAKRCYKDIHTGQSIPLILFRGCPRCSERPEGVYIPEVEKWNVQRLCIA